MGLRRSKSSGEGDCEKEAPCRSSLNDKLEDKRVACGGGGEVWKLWLAGWRKSRFTSTPGREMSEGPEHEDEYGAAGKRGY